MPEKFRTGETAGADVAGIGRGDGTGAVRPASDPVPGRDLPAGHRTGARRIDVQRSRIVRSAVTLTALTLVAGAGAYALHGGSSTPPGVSPRLGLAAYRSFSGCDDLLSYLRAQALPLVGSFGLDGQIVPGGPMGLRGLAPGALPRAADGAASGGAGAGSTTAGPAGAAATSVAEASGATSATGTNIQVAGVDEADVTKKSGDLVLTVAAGA